MGEKSVGETSLGENRGRWDAGFRSPLLRFWKVLDAYFGIFLCVSDLYKSFPKQCGKAEGFLR